MWKYFRRLLKKRNLEELVKDISGHGGVENILIKKPKNPILTQPLPISSSSSHTNKEESEKIPEDLHPLPNEYPLGSFVYCWGFANNEEDFGIIHNRIDEMYVVKLINLKPKWASVPIENMRIAGRT